MAQSIRGDVGVLIKIDMLEDMTAATGIMFEVLKPQGQRVKWTPNISGNYLQYTTVDGDLDQSGIYKISPKLTLTGFDGRGKYVEVEVIEKYG